MIRILYEDTELIICIKPVNILSEEGGMPELLAERCGVPRVFCVHRLDKAVSGVMVYAKNGKTAAKLSAMIAEKGMKKEYLAVIEGFMPEPQGTLTDLLYHDSRTNKTFPVKRMRKGVKEAVLHYETIRTLGDCSLIRVELETGRSHQIRVQFASRKHPLLGDTRYGSAFRDLDIALFSHRLRFRHPVKEKYIDISADMPTGAPWVRFR